MLLAERMRRVGFRREFFSDGWFWYFQPPLDSAAARVIARALGRRESELLEMPQGSIILQYDERGHRWQYVFHRQAAFLTLRDALAILDRLEELNKA